MPIRTVPGQEARYFLLCFDKDGLEQREHDGTLLSGQVLQAVKSHPPPTDVIIISHGWMGDVDAAIAQYDRWIAAFTAVHGDAAAATQRDPNFRPLVVGLHWPSLPWGDETIPEAGSMLLGAAAPYGAREVSLWAKRIADTPAATDRSRDHPRGGDQVSGGRLVAARPRGLPAVVRRERIAVRG